MQAATEALAGSIPKHCADLMMVRRVLRHLESRVWRWESTQRDGIFQYRVFKATISAREKSLRDEHLAVASALDALTRVLEQRNVRAA